MKNKLASVIKGLDILVLLFALISPPLFVEFAVDVLNFFLLKEIKDPSFAYTLLIFIISSLFSFIRRIKLEVIYRLPVILLSSLAAAIFFYIEFLTSEGGDNVYTIKEVTEPYIDYLVALFFSLGAGYCFAHVLIYLRGRFKND